MPKYICSEYTNREENLVHLDRLKAQWFYYFLGMLNICQLVWECWGEDANSPMQYGMLLFDLDQWYKDQMPGNFHWHYTD